jgi:hypothetical protein
MLTDTCRPLRGGVRPRARAVEPAAALEPPRPEGSVNPDVAVALAVRRHAIAAALDDTVRSTITHRLRLEALDQVLAARCARAATREAHP